MRLAHNQIQQLRRDTDILRDYLDALLQGQAESPAQVILNTIETIRDIRASIDAIHHFAVVVVLDTYLRDNPIVYDQENQPWKYRGQDALGMRFSATSYRTLRVVDLFEDGFTTSLGEQYTYQPQGERARGTVFPGLGPAEDLRLAGQSPDGGHPVPQGQDMPPARSRHTEEYFPA